MMVKYRVREVAKDLNIPNKEVIDTLAKFFPEPKKYMTALEENELDIVLESFTQQRNMESLDSYFAERTAAPAAQAESPRKRPRPRRRGTGSSRIRARSPRKRRGKSPSRPRQSSRRSPPRPLPESSRPLCRCGSRSSLCAGWWIPARLT